MGPAKPFPTLFLSQPGQGEECFDKPHGGDVRPPHTAQGWALEKPSPGRAHLTHAVLGPQVAMEAVGLLYSLRAGSSAKLGQLPPPSAVGLGPC